MLLTFREVYVVLYVCSGYQAMSVPNYNLLLVEVKTDCEPISRPPSEREEHILHPVRSCMQQTFW